ncbi:MAG: OmpA family protein [Myxococcaceae bacterium]|nr:OmpA family protein [Myxococcaceae bacterium]
MFRWFWAAATMLVASSAWADAVYISVTNRAFIGRGFPTVHVQILEPVAGFRLQLKRSDGKAVDIKGGGKPGQTRDLALVQPVGAFKYEGQLTINLPDGKTSEMPLGFDTAMFGPLEIKLEKKDVDLEQRSLTFRLTRPAAKAEVKVRMDTGDMAMNEEVLFNGAPAGTDLKVTWPKAPGKVMMIGLKATDTEAFFTGVDLFPWSIDIPHEEVNFDSGKSDIRPEEAPKLDKSLELITDAYSKYSQWADIKLYVLGFTDTVGGTDYNRTLSLNRARSMASYFRKRGLKAPIRYEGFGEQALEVPTPDETDEIRNRRARYILSVEDPVTDAPIRPRWQSL